MLIAFTSSNYKHRNYLEMSNKRKGQLTVATEWAKHLRKFLRRQFWKGERKAGQKLIRQEINEKNNR
jgi:hypothetical protein